MAKAAPKKVGRPKGVGGRPAQDRKDAFVREYVKDYKARQAAIRAGIPPKGAHVTATRLLKDAYVNEQIAIYEAELREKYDLTHDKIIRDMIDTGYAAFIAGQFAAAISAKKLVGMHVGLWKTTSEVTEPGGGAIPITAAHVVLGAAEMMQEERDFLRAILLKA